MTSDLVKTDIVMPAVTPEQFKIAWKQYQDLKAAIIESSDIQKIQGKDFLKKSYWRKIATAFNLSLEVVEEHKEQIGHDFAWHFTCKATAGNGRSAVGVGSCSAFEKAVKNGDGYVDRYGKKAVPNSIHNIRATAETRAFNRAVSNLVGGGEVSAEEVDQVHGEELAEEVSQHV